MLDSWTIRAKLQLGLGVLLLSVLALFVSGYYGLYAYRALVKDLSHRSAELPIASEMLMRASDLRVILCQANERLAPDESPLGGAEPFYSSMLREEYNTGLSRLIDSVERYRARLDVPGGARLTTDSRERKVLGKIDDLIKELGGDESSATLEEDWLLDLMKIGHLRDKVEELCELVAQVPGHMQQEISELALSVRSKYRTAIVTAWLTVVVTTSLLIVAARMFFKWIAQPLQTLVEGSREVARGNFDHQIEISTRDEMGELAEAMNAMTDRFRETRDELDQQVQERTNQVVRSEQLASVGFLAAGVAHEINNPLASIAICSESLEGRLADSLSDEQSKEVAQNYLQMIQREAFRCKEITERLLDFARKGGSERESTELRDLVTGVLEMVQHVGKYRDKNLTLEEGDQVFAEVNGQEIKQVVLNLVTNALESIDTGGSVAVSVRRENATALISVTDDGCGMTDEVKKHLFEPFFTKRRSGQGIGLGLSITYRIVQEHRGSIDVQSDGPGRGSRFVVSLPAHGVAKEESHRYQAA